MNIVCKGCGADINVPNKKSQIRKSCNKTHRIVVCKSCGGKNFVPIMMRYSENHDENW